MTVTEAGHRYATGIPATPGQIDFINVLKKERRVPESLVEGYRELWRRGGFTAKVASALISEMEMFPKIEKVYEKNVSLEGIHNVKGQVIKVQRARESGYLYTKVLTQGLDGKWTFVRLQGGLKLVGPRTKITLEDAKKYGKLYGTCCICGRTLTDETSISNGIGPICAEKV